MKGRENITESLEVIWRMQMVVGQSWGGLRKSKTRHAANLMEVPGTPRKDGAASRPPLLLLQLCRCRQIFPRSLNVKASAVAHRVVRSDLGLHLLHPGHVPVPHRNALLLPEQVALWLEWRIQDAEGGSWRREVWTQKEFSAQNQKNQYSYK